MIEYIKGELTELTPALATIEAGGIGYGLNISLNTFSAIQKLRVGDGTSGMWSVLERSIRHAATFAANYHHRWGKYGLNVNLNGRLQSKTYYPGYEEDRKAHV